MIITATRYGSSSGGGGSSSTIRYSLISGATPTYLEDSETGDWELVFLSSCKIKVSTAVSVDVFAVGGGAAGGEGSGGNAKAYGGSGGNGGACVTSTKTLTANTEYQIDVGASGQSTSAFEVTAASGGGASGGGGGYAVYGGGGTSHAPYPGDTGGPGNGSLAFGRASASTGRTLYEQSFDQQGQDPVVIYFGAGGDGGGALRIGEYTASGRSLGGTTGGGAGGPPTSNSDSLGKGENGQENTGAGGGGGSAGVPNAWSPVSTMAPGLGGSGIVIIRNHREET